MSFISIVADIVNVKYPDVLEKHNEVVNLRAGFDDKYNDFTNETDGKYEEIVAKYDNFVIDFRDFIIKYSDFTSADGAKYEDMIIKHEDLVNKFNDFISKYNDMTNSTNGKYEDFISKYNDFNINKVMIDEKLSVFDMDYLVALNSTMSDIKDMIETQNSGTFFEFTSAFEASNA